LTAGCASLIAAGNLPSHVVVFDETDQTQTVTVDSEPQGARVIRDGVTVGTTPAALDLAYKKQKSEGRLRYCWLQGSLALVDIAASGAGVWGSYSGLYQSGHRFWGVTGIVGAGLYGLIGVIAGANAATGCPTDKEAQSVVVPQNHPLRLVKDGWEESLNVRVPTPAGGDKIAVVFSGPAWQEAKMQDTVPGYQDFLRRFPSGRWAEQAEKAIVTILENRPDSTANQTLVELVFSPDLTLRVPALVALLGKHATADVEEMMTSAETEWRRESLVVMLGQIANTAKHPDCAAAARTILCNFVSSRSRQEDWRRELEAPCAEHRSPLCDSRGGPRPSFEQSEIVPGPYGSMVHQTTTIYGDNYDCAERDKRRKCEAEAHRTIERLVKQAREAGRCATR
jgi:hypothetical protein